MSDALNQKDCCRELAAGCRRLAAISFSSETRNHFLRLAEHYSALAEAEEQATLLDTLGG
jgi:hypothetical protein